MKSGRLIIYSLTTALACGILSGVSVSPAEAQTTARPYLPDSPYETRRRAHAAESAGAPTRRLANPEVIYQDAPNMSQNPSGMVTETPVTLDAPVPLEVEPLYPQRARIQPQPSISPVTQEMLNKPAQPSAPQVAPYAPPQVATDSGLQLPPPPGAAAMYDAVEPLDPSMQAQPQMRTVRKSKSAEQADSLWDYLSGSEEEVVTYEPTPMPNAGGALPPPPPSLGSMPQNASLAPDPYAAQLPNANAPKPFSNGNTVNLDVSQDPAAHMPEPTRSAHNALSAESRNMLGNIPDNLTPVEMAPKKEVTVSRIDPDVANILQASSDTNVASDSSAQMGVQVKRPNYDVDYELEKAYQSVVAGDIPEAVETYKEALSVAPRDQVALFGLASTYHRIGSMDNARALYARLLEINPDHVEGLNNFLALVAEESPEEAMPELQVLANKHPGFSPIQAQLGLLYQQMGEFKKAREHMLRAVRITPENMTYRYNLAIILDQQGAYAEAANVYRYLIGVAERGVQIPAAAEDLQARLTYILSQT